MPSYGSSFQTALLRTQQALAPRFRAVYGPFGLTTPQWRVLRVLWERDGCSVSEIAAGALLDQPVVVGVIDRLVRAGLVERERSEEDRRRVHVRLTEAGHNLEHEVAPLVRDVYADLESTLTHDQWQQLFALLGQVEQHFSHK